MTLRNEERRIVSDLASGAIDGRLTPAQQVQLEQWLRTSEEARAYYVRLMGLSASLAWAGRSAMPAAAAQTRFSWRRRWYPAAAAAAVLVLAGLAVWFLREKPPAPPPAPVAVLSNAVNLEWENAQEPLHVGNVLKPDWMRIKSGLAQIEFLSGASVWLEGPATMRLDEMHGGYCEKGKIVAVVPKGSEGIRVDTPLGSVTDHGTGFGIEVTPGRVTVHVFEGIVDVTPAGGATKRYFAGKSVALFPDGKTFEGMADASVFDYQGYGWTVGYGWSEGYMAWDGWPPHSYRWPVPPAWKGGNPLDYIRDQLGVDAARWQVLEPKIGAFLEAQQVVPGEGYPWLDNDVSRALVGLRLCLRNPFATEDELSNSLWRLRDARQVARDKLDTAEKALRTELTASEEARLLMLGYLK